MQNIHRKVENVWGNHLKCVFSPELPGVLVYSMLCVCVRADSVAVVGVPLAESRLCWHGEPESVISCQAETARQMSPRMRFYFWITSLSVLMGF